MPPSTVAASTDADLFRERAHGDQVVHLERILGELPDGEDRAVQRQRRHDDVDAGSVGEAGVHHGRGLVDAPAHRRHDALDDAAQVLFGDEAHLGLLDDAAALDVDVVAAVDHDLVHGRVVEELLDGPETHDVPRDVPHETLALLRGQRRLGRFHEGADLGHHQRVQLILVGCLEQPGSEALEQRVVNPGLEVAEPVDGHRPVRRLAPLAGDLAALRGSLLWPG